MLPFAVLAPAPLVAALPPRPPVSAEVGRAARRVTGRVSDAATGKPIAAALVQQAGAVATGFTDAEGAYTLALDAKAVAAVLVSAAGYESRRVAIAGDRLDVALSPLRSYVPTRPAQPIIELPNSKAEVAPFNSGVRFTYSLRHQDIASGGTAISGNVTNEFALGLRYRARPWLVEAEGGHYQSRVDVPNLSTASNPAFKPSTWQAALRGGYMIALRPELETALMLGYRYRNVAPNNNEIPYTGTGLDASQTQHGLGGVAAAAWKPGAGRVVLEGALGLYPLVFANSDDARVAPFAGSLGADARAAALYEVIPGLRAGLGYQLETWRGTGTDTSSVFSVLLHYTPGGLPRGNEP